MEALCAIPCSRRSRHTRDVRSESLAQQTVVLGLREDLLVLQEWWGTRPLCFWDLVKCVVVV